VENVMNNTHGNFKVVVFFQNKRGHDMAQMQSTLLAMMQFF
jgi:hypothetical protein